MVRANVRTDKYFTAYHYVPDSDDDDKEGYAMDVGLVNVACNIQPSSAEIAELYGGAYGKTHLLFTTSSGLVIGDKITVSGLINEYIVQGKQYYDYPPGEHGEYVITEIQP